MIDSRAPALELRAVRLQQLGAMSGTPLGFNDISEAVRRSARRSYDRGAPHNSQPSEVFARSLPRELDFLVRRGFSPQGLFGALAAAPRDVHPLDAILAEGVVEEEVYYRALARHLGCQYYSGAPLFAANLDAMKGLRCGVAPLEPGDHAPRAVIAPRGKAVSLLIDATMSGRIRSGAFSITSPQRFARLVRARHGDAILDEALDRLPTSLTARQGMTGLQIAAVGAITTCACVLGFERFDLLCAFASAGLWLTFSAAIVLRSMAAVANTPEIRLPTLVDDELPVYTVIAALYRETDVIDDLVNAFNAFDYPVFGSKLT